jgi:hypothetical protein
MQIGMEGKKMPPQENSIKGERTGGVLNRIRNGLHDFLTGAALHEMQQAALQERVARQDLFLLVTFGDLIGLPILPSPYALRMLPHVFPNLESWKKRMVRKRDLTAKGDL